MKNIYQMLSDKPVTPSDVAKKLEINYKNTKERETDHGALLQCYIQQ